jgi:hypothetical protein
VMFSASFSMHMKSSGKGAVSAPGAIRTHNLGFRRALLYPFELLGLDAIILYEFIRNI